MNSGVDIILPPGVAKNQALRTLWTAAGPKARVAPGGRILRGLDPDPCPLRQGILLAAHNDFQFVRSVGEAAL